ncbi:hypothetical protein [Natrialbaceae archaeon AArc-T1-2]|uniref:hypothetical protein n=1 Tax=Natrialbaceae archaeon AArc-T1-2 TaxID=3053904 RepID=UPI00255AB3FF|nr:hypothetical protein [Natrialbaceae archaeon AArc-T1-2]WIV66426.1 hypothetical protein QQ977_12095 [Natrialbaceae archaeon AArc-T1-2]
MSADTTDPGPDVTRVPSFFDRLEDAGGLAVEGVLEALAPEVQIAHEGPVERAGVVFHYRGVRVPGYDATFVHERSDARDVPAFSLEVDTIGPRNTWAVFDATLGWDVYLVRTADATVLAWMSDEEFEAEEAGRFDSKREAVAAGRFSLGVFLRTGEEWAQRRELMERTETPALIQLEDGRTLVPETQGEFYEEVDSTVVEFRLHGGGAPDYLGVLELEMTVEE